MIRIIDKHDCCGCSACEAICGVKAITLNADSEGFLYPESNLNLCIDCGLCERVCPIIKRDTQQCEKLPIKVFALQNLNKETLLTSSSGGVFAALVQWSLNNKGIIYGVVYDDNFAVVHRGETTKEGALLFRGSKYVQSDLRGVYTKIRRELKSGRNVLFSGVPCQVEGLKSFLMREYDNLTTVDILCHGVPSPKVFADYVSFIKRHTPVMLESIFMKDKTFGWGYQNLKLVYQRGISEFNTPVSNLWNKLFYDHVINRPSCHACRFKNLHRAGDISIGDFWGIEKNHPEFLSSQGVSLLLVNSLRGEYIWKSINPQFKYIESDTEKCMQPVLKESHPEATDRDEFWMEYNEHGFEKTIMSRYAISKVMMLKRWLTIVAKSFLN